MDSKQLNLPLFLWAISLNVLDLVTNSKARFARTTLMMSDELPSILANWHRPRTHNCSTRTKAAIDVMNTCALDIISETLGNEMQVLKPVMKFLQQDLSEESLLGISLKELILAVKVTLTKVLWGSFGQFNLDAVWN
jgi:hypothetical protein